MDSSNFQPPVGTVDGYFPRFELPSWFDGPDELKNLLAMLWGRAFFEIDDHADRTYRLHDAFVAIVEMLWGNGRALGHRRLLWMGYALALAASHTVRRHRPDELRHQRVLDATESVIRGEAIELDPDELFPLVSLGDMTIDEAIDTYRNLAFALEPEQACERLLEMLEECLEDSAVHPGSQGRRDLFNWWLVQVVPAAWCERLPDRIYTGAWPWPPR
jgi:hypothetical protein